MLPSAVSILHPFAPTLRVECSSPPRANSRSHLTPGRSMVQTIPLTHGPSCRSKADPMAKAPDPRSRAYPSATANLNSLVLTRCARGTSLLRALLGHDDSLCIHGSWSLRPFRPKSAALASKPRHGRVDGKGRGVMSRFRPIIKLKPMIRTGGARDMFRCCSHPWQWSFYWCRSGSSPIPDGVKSQAVILHTRPWLSLLAELSDTILGCWTNAQRGGYCPPGNTKAMGLALGVVQDWPDRKGES